MTVHRSTSQSTNLGVAQAGKMRKLPGMRVHIRCAGVYEKCSRKGAKKARNSFYFFSAPLRLCVRIANPFLLCASAPLRAWHSHISNKSVAWQSWAEVKATFRTASHVGNCVVFNVAGNKYRLVTRILYQSHKVFVLKVMTHAEYDDDKWKEDCGCYQPPPIKWKFRPADPSKKRKKSGA